MANLTGAQMVEKYPWMAGIVDPAAKYLDNPIYGQAMKGSDIPLDQRVVAGGDIIGGQLFDAGSFDPNSFYSSRTDPTSKLNVNAMTAADWLPGYLGSGYGGSWDTAKSVLGDVSQKYGGIDSQMWSDAMQKYIQNTGGSAQDAAWWGDQAGTRAYLQGLSALDPKYSNAWNDYVASGAYNPGLEQQQQAKSAQVGQAAQAANGDDGTFSKLMPMIFLAALSAGTGGFGLSSLFGDAAATTGAMDMGAGFGSFGAGDAAGMLGNGLYGNGITSAIGYGANPTAVSSAGSNGMFDLTDFLNSFSPDSFSSGYGGLDLPSVTGAGGLDTGLTGSELWGGLGSAPVGSGGFTLSDLFGNNGSSILKALGGSSSLLGAGLGGLLGGLGGNSKPAGSTTSTTVQDLPDWYKPYAMGLLNQASQTFNAQQPYNPALVNAATNQQMANITGANLNGNPYLDDTFNRAADNVTKQYTMATKPGMDAQFARSNAFGVGNSAWEQYDAEGKRQLGNSLANLGNQIYGQNYQTERGYQNTSAMNAPMFSNNAATAPYGNVNAFGQAIGNVKPGSTTTQSNPYYTNPYGSALGGALAGSQLGKLFG